MTPDATAAGLLIRVPASTSNLGPGFDTLGLALTWYNDFIVRPLDEEPSRFIGRGACEGMSGGRNICLRMMARVARLAGAASPPVEVTAVGTVPPGVGLGSSASACVAGALAANRLLGEPLAREALLEPLIRAEGHPDNVTPSLLGGLTATAVTDEGPLVRQYPIAPIWRVVLLVPDYALSTRRARRMLPDRVPLADAVHNLQRLPFVIEALVEGDAERLSRALADRLHERHRAKHIRRYKRLRAAARDAGAAAVFISGSGPALAALCAGEEAAGRVAAAMAEVVRGAPFSASTHVVAPEPRGATLTAAP